MDDKKRDSLKLIEELSKDLPIEDQGMQLLFIVKDHLEDANPLEALRVLRLIDEKYYDQHMYQHAAEYHTFGEAVATIIQEWGHSFWIFGRDPEGTA